MIARAETTPETSVEAPGATSTDESKKEERDKLAKEIFAMLERRLTVEHERGGYRLFRRP
jgi:hypothetical protein